MTYKTILLFTCTLVSCTPFVTVTPDPRRPQLGQVAGASLRVVYEPWQGEPHDLPAYFLPVAVELHQQGADTIEVNPADFVLLDGQGKLIPPCLMDHVLTELPRPRITQGPGFSTTPRAVGSADPQTEIAFAGETTPPPISDAQRLALPKGILRPSERQRGYLYFRVPNPDRPQSLRLRWQPHKAGTSTLLGETEVALAVTLQQPPR